MLYQRYKQGILKVFGSFITVVQHVQFKSQVVYVVYIMLREHRNVYISNI